jgi:hypothetical protein
MSDTPTKFSEFIRNASLEEKERVYAKVMNEATEAQNNAGINSQHNACTFRADCQKAEAEIARLREDAERYRWLRPRIIGFDADFCQGGLGVVFKFPENSRVGIGASLDAAIDAARKATK